MRSIISEIVLTYSRCRLNSIFVQNHILVTNVVIIFVLHAIDQSNKKQNMNREQQKCTVKIKSKYIEKNKQLYVAKTVKNNIARCIRTVVKIWGSMSLTRIMCACTRSLSCSRRHVGCGDQRLFCFWIWRLITILNKYLLDTIVMLN